MRAGPDPGPSVDERAWIGVAREQVRAALRRLPDPHREVIELAYFDGYSQSELAERLALPLGTVKSRTFAAMKELRNALAGDGRHAGGRVEHVDELIPAHALGRLDADASSRSVAHLDGCAAAA